MSGDSDRHCRPSIETAPEADWDFGNESHDIFFKDHAMQRRSFETSENSYKHSHQHLLQYHPFASSRTRPTADMQQLKDFNSSSEEPQSFATYSIDTSMQNNSKFFAAGICSRSTSGIVGAGLQHRASTPYDDTTSSNPYFARCMEREITSFHLSSKSASFKLIAAQFNHNGENIRFNHFHRRRVQPRKAKAVQHASKEKKPASDDAGILATTSSEETFQLLQPQDSTVLNIAGLPQSIALRHVYNLFSNYGDIEECVRDEATVYCEYHDVRGARAAKEHLHLREVRSQTIRVSFAPQAVLARLSSRDALLHASPSRRRFKNSSPKQANKVSKHLHISIFFSKNRRPVADQELVSLFPRAYAPVGLRRDKNKDNCNMWFLDFASEEAAMEVLMEFHNSTFESGNLRVSYTSSNRL